MTLEHRLGAKASLELDYNGSHGVHLYDIKNINPIGGGQAYLGDPLVTADPNNPACSAASPCLTRVNPAYTSINNRGTNAFSHYNALNVRFSTEELGHTGLFILSNYTYAHALDNLSSTFSESNTEFNLGYLDPTNPWVDYGNADFDQRHRLALEMTWSEPFFKSGKGALRQAAGGWQVSPIFTVRSGAPFSVVGQHQRASVHSAVRSHGTYFQPKDRAPSGFGRTESFQHSESACGEQLFQPSA